MFKKLFNIGSASTDPVEPIFPTERFSIFKLTIEGGLALATINTGYDNYQNKSCYPWYTAVTMHIHDKNENGHPTNEEAEILNNLEEKIVEFLKRTQIVHAVGRVTRNGERDIFYYTDEPKFNPGNSREFFDAISAVRLVNISVEKDKKWSNVAAFIK